MTKTELGLGIGSLLSASMNIYLYWKFGGKQTKDNERADAITMGTDKIVDSSNKLLDRMDLMLEQERQRLAVEQEYLRVEREHRADCEEKLKLFEQRINELEKKV